MDKQPQQPDTNAAPANPPIEVPIGDLLQEFNDSLATEITTSIQEGLNEAADKLAEDMIDIIKTTTLSMLLGMYLSVNKIENEKLSFASRYFAQDYIKTQAKEFMYKILAFMADTTGFEQAETEQDRASREDGEQQFDELFNRVDLLKIIDVCRAKNSLLVDIAIDMQNKNFAELHFEDKLADNKALITDFLYDLVDCWPDSVVPAEEYDDDSDPDPRPAIEFTSRLTSVIKRFFKQLAPDPDCVLESIQTLLFSQQPQSTAPVRQNTAAISAPRLTR